MSLTLPSSPSARIYGFPNVYVYVLILSTVVPNESEPRRAFPSAPALRLPPRPDDVNTLPSSTPSGKYEMRNDCHQFCRSHSPTIRSIEDVGKARDHVIDDINCESANLSSKKATEEMIYVERQLDEMGSKQSALLCFANSQSSLTNSRFLSFLPPLMHFEVTNEVSEAKLGCRTAQSRPRQLN